MENLHDKLVYIQSALKAPKNQRNSFGNYNYRSCEDILEAVKPLLKETGLRLTLSDEIVQLDNGITYVEATVIITDGEKAVPAKSSAGIDVNKKGMDVAQTFGAASSYARKYALNGLFLIDDTKDADATNSHGKSAPAATQVWLNANTEQFNNAKKAISSGKFTIQDIRKKYKVSKEVEKQLLN
jgi:hypothetical protein